MLFQTIAIATQEQLYDSTQTILPPAPILDRTTEAKLTAIVVACYDVLRLLIVESRIVFTPEPRDWDSFESFAGLAPAPSRCEECKKILCAVEQPVMRVVNFCSPVEM